MRGVLTTNTGYTIMAADVTSEMEYRPMAGFSLSLSGDDGDTLRGYWEKLSGGESTTMPAAKAGLGRRVSACAWTNSACPG